MKNDQVILRERAKRVAGRKTETEKMGKPILVVEFLLIPEKYCIESSFVTEVLPVKGITLIPGTPDFVAGVMNMRGKIISVINIRYFFNLRDKGISELNKIIVLNHNQIEFGILADSITGTREIDADKLSAPPVTVNGTGAGYIKGITADGHILLDAAAILTSKMIIVNQK